MGATKKIRQIMIERNVQTKELAKKLDMKQQALSTKLYRDSMGFSDVEKIADALNCDVKLVTRDTGKSF